MKMLFLSLTLFSAAGVAGTESYTYDAAGRLIAVDYGSVVIRYTYDKNGNLLAQSAEKGASRSDETQKAKEKPPSDAASAAKPAPDSK